ncbi:MAG: DUF1552 domain-containing protein [Planctomycetia bacterium]|nr:DUF1552 domain-containing protein [Planctomycetia bacterium]
MSGDRVVHVAARRLARRTLLRGLGIALPLPWLEAMGTPMPRARSAEPGLSAPNRVAFLYAPNGQHMPDWTPRTEGDDFELSPILAPLAGVRKKLLVLSGLAADKARSHGDGGGDHARAMAAFLTGVHPRKTDGTSIRNGTSADQIAAAAIGGRTRLPSLEIGADKGAMAGDCDSGYSCVYSSTMSWRSPTQPVPKEVNPRMVFDRLFGDGDPAAAVRHARRRSILDFIAEDTRGLERRLGAADRRKLDEYFSAVREIELRIERAASRQAAEVPATPPPAAGIPADYGEHIRLLCDLVALAFQCDATRVVTFVLANEGSNKPYPFIGVPEGHHDLSHHGGNAEKQAKIRAINLFHCGRVAYLLERLDAVQEGEGTLLDHSMIVYGGGIHDGNRHNHEDLPIILAGGGCGTLKTGRHLRFPAETPLGNLWLSLLDRMEATVEQLGDSTGRLPALQA